MKKIYYKAFKRDMTCRGMQFKEGRTYTQTGELELCVNGFHFCQDLVLTLTDYPVTKITDNRYAEVEVLGKVIFEQPTEHRGVTNRIKIVRVLSDDEVQDFTDRHRNSGNRNSGNENSGDGNSGDRNSGHDNSGNRNSGDENSGNRNSGHDNSGHGNSGHDNSGHRNSGNENSGNRNSGHENSGDGNSGDRNSGSWNACNNSSGVFNSKPETEIRVFGKMTPLQVWNDADKPDLIFFSPENGETYKEAFKRSWTNSTDKDRQKVRDLPNFDAEIFFEISGISVSGESE